MIHNVAPEIETYFIEQYEKQDIRVVPGHWPLMQTKSDVDKWIEDLQLMKRMFECFSNKKTEDRL